MPASGYSIAAVIDVPAGGSINNLIENLPGVKLAQASLVIIYLTRQSVDVLISATVGGTVVYPSGPTNISTVLGSLPSTQDDKIIICMADAGSDIILASTNANAAAQEARALVQVLPIDDAILLHAAKIRTGQ